MASEKALSEETLTEFRQAFQLFDKDGDGHITVAEFREVMLAIGQNPSEEDISNMIKTVRLGPIRPCMLVRVCSCAGVYSSRLTFFYLIFSRRRCRLTKTKMGR